MQEPTPIDLAVRVYPEISDKVRRPKLRRHWRRPSAMLVFDTETRTDATQGLMFGCFRYIVDGQCVREGLFHAHDLSKAELANLRKYSSSHSAAVAQGGRKLLDLLTLDEFLDELYRAAYKGRCLVVGFNLPFDLSRVAFDVAPARGKYAGGFSLGMWSYVDKKGRRKRNAFRPRIAIKHIDSKRSLIAFTAQRDPDAIDLRSEDGSKEPTVFRGHFLDLRTLTFALTNGSHSLKSACIAFGITQGKTDVSEHGRITPTYIDYSRRDVEATSKLAQKVLAEFDRHPISLAETKAFSPASIGKAYLRELGITPVAERQASLQPFIGYAQSAFFGGRTSAHIRKSPVPVVYTDFLSMYPTVNSLMNLWEFVTANEIKVNSDCIDEVTAMLKNISVEKMFDPRSWRGLHGFVRVVPNGDILPARAKYNPDTNDWQVGINHLYTNGVDKDALWYSIPDVAASILLTGKVPQIVDAFMLEPHGQLPTLRQVKLRGAIEVDPRQQDFFRVVIEERKRLSRRNDISKADREQLGEFLKVLANATSFGIYGEMNRLEAKEPMRVQCYGIDANPFSTLAANPEIPGEFCSPLLASLITGGGRFMLALLEKSVTDLGGTYAMEDTDSMAIVATEHGGLIECPGGPYRTRKGGPAISALSFQQVRSISDRFRSLNPYNHEAVPGSILKIEDDNFDPVTRKQRQLWCFAISAKRYVLFGRDSAGNPVLLRAGVNNEQDRWSEHGLGHLMNPTDPARDDRGWIRRVWEGIVGSTPTKGQRSGYEQTPAVGKVAVSNPSILRALDEINEGKEYTQRIKPFNFLCSCQVLPMGHPPGVDPARFHLIAPYETDPKKWPHMSWVDQHSGKLFRISALSQYSSRQTARVKNFGDVISAYALHAEPKCADSTGNVCGKSTVGLLQRRHVRIDRIRFIGKESNLIEEVAAGLIHSDFEAYTEYIDPSRDNWERIIRPALKNISLSVLCKETGLSRRMIINTRTGKTRPHQRNRQIFSRLLGRYLAS